LAGWPFSGGQIITVAWFLVGAVADPVALPPQPLAAQGAERGVIEGAGAIDVAGADGDVADHDEILLPRS